MKVGFIISPNACISGKSNGVRAQAMSMAEAMRVLGIDVTLVSSWDSQPINEYDIIHFFQTGAWLDGLAEKVAKQDIPFVISPIIDSNKNPTLSSIKSKIDFINYIRNTQINRSLKIANTLSVRSKYESNYVKKRYNIPENRISVVPVGVNIEHFKVNNHKRKNRVLHVSSIDQERKNVNMLIDACLNEKIPLDLVGNTKKNFTDSTLGKRINLLDPKKVKYHGFVTRIELLELYLNSKVFALPSLMEGVGIVALEAALRGCEIVLTNKGGPKEYYDGMAHLVDPHSIKSIQNGIRNALSKSYQPSLKNHIKSKYSLERIAQMQIAAYKRLIN